MPFWVLVMGLASMAGVAAVTASLLLLRRGTGAAPSWRRRVGLLALLLGGVALTGAGPWALVRYTIPLANARQEVLRRAALDKTLEKPLQTLQVHFYYPDPLEHAAEGVALRFTFTPERGEPLVSEVPGSALLPGRGEATREYRPYDLPWQAVLNGAVRPAPADLSRINDLLRFSRLTMEVVLPPERPAPIFLWVGVVTGGQTLACFSAPVDPAGLTKAEDGSSRQPYFDESLHHRIKAWKAKFPVAALPGPDWPVRAVACVGLLALLLGGGLVAWPAFGYIWAGLGSLVRFLSHDHFAGEPEREIVIPMRTRIALGGLALGLAAVCTFLAAEQNARFLEEHSLYGDTASYTFFDVQAYLHAKHEGRWQAICHQLMTNGRNPFRIVPVLALNPEWLATGNGHLVTAGFALFCFLSLLGLAVHQRTGSFPYAILAMLAILLPESFFDPVLGLAANHPDFVGGLFVGSAFLALLLSREGRDLHWLVTFGIFAALATLSRWVAAGYTFIICGPPLFYYLVRRWRDSERLWPEIVGKCAGIAVPILLLAGHFLFSFTKCNLLFYSSYGYAMHSPFLLSVDNLTRVGGLYFGLPGCLSLGALCLVYFACWGWAGRGWADVLITAWAPLSFALLFIFILRVSGDPQQPFYEIVLLHIFLATPFSVRPGASVPFGFGKHVALGALAVVVAVAGYSLHAASVRYQTPTQAEAAEVAFQRTLTRLLIEQGAARKHEGELPSFDTFFSPYGRSLVIEALIRHNEELRWRSIFDKHDFTWKARYPERSAEEMAEDIYKRVWDELDYVAILDDPQTGQALPMFCDDHNRVQGIALEVIDRMNKRLRADSQEWALCGQVASPWGTVSLYRKTGGRGG